MNIIISGKPHDIPASNNGISVLELLREVDVEMPEMVSVELNGTILFREDYPNVRIKNGDSVEFLYFMGGGI